MLTYRRLVRELLQSLDPPVRTIRWPSSDWEESVWLQLWCVHVPAQASGETTTDIYCIQAAKLKGCRTIIGIDRVPARLELAKSLGATHGINTSTLTSTLEQAVRDVTDGTGSTITVDATGVVALIKQGVEFTANQGKMILLGVAPMDAKLEIPIVPHMVVSAAILHDIHFFFWMAAKGFVCTDGKAYPR